MGACMPELRASIYHQEWRASQENFGPGGKSSQSREFMNMSHKAMEESFAEDYDSDFW